MGALPAAELAALAERCGADASLAKPFDGEALRAAVLRSPAARRSDQALGHAARARLRPGGGRRGDPARSARHDRRLCADVLGAFIGALTRSLRWRAKRQLGLRSVKDALVSAVTFVQRNDSPLRLNPRARVARHASHERCHTLALDGGYVRAEDGELQFHPLGEPTGEEVAEVAARTHAKLPEVLERHGRSLEGVEDAPDPLREEQPGLASWAGASAAGVQQLGDAPGSRTDKLVRLVQLVPSPSDLNSA